jgi:hypothetical protein
MDTRYWGPSGWRLLHLITFAYNPHTDKVKMREFFQTIPFILPCKYCRTSLAGYMETYSLEQALDSRDSLTKWLWKIHNEVNSKLRNQRLTKVTDPPFDDVEKFYKNILSSGCSKTYFPGWEFLFSIADLHPLSQISRKSSPMPGAPPCDSIGTLEEKNKWNCLTPEERLSFFNTFWRSVGIVLPFKEWRESWIKHGTFTALDSRSETMKWLWKIRCTMESDLNLLNKCKYSSLCKNLSMFRSDCLRSTKGKTCRKRRKD